MDLVGLQKCRKQTKQDILKLLETNDQVGCVRWTGFGKSYMIKELYNELPGKKLILTSTTALRDEFDSKNYECITYELLHYRIENNNFLNKYNNIKYLFLDECHRASPTNQWGRSLEKFINQLDCKVLGFTATPIRGDGVDTMQYWFNNIQVNPMYINDAYELKYINSITYVKSYFNIEETKTEIKKIIEAEDYNISEVNLDNVIGVKEIIKKYYNQKLNGNKIIVFCSKVNDLKNIRDYYFNLFQNLFPKKDINTYIISYKDLLNDQLDKFKKHDDGINIIFTVDKLTEGIHIEKVNTLIFMRPTGSEVKYFQQLGRGINGGQQSLIFDFANNCNRVLKNNSRSNPKPNKNYKKENTQLDKLMDLIEVKDYTTEINEVFDEIFNKNRVSEEIKNYLLDNAKIKTIPELSNDTGVNVETIRYILNSSDIEYKRARKRYDYSYVDLYHEDETLSELSDHTEIPEDSIRRYCKRNNIEFKPSTIKYDYSYVDLHYKDETISELSDHTGIPEEQIRKYCLTKKLKYKKQKSNRALTDYSYVDSHHENETISELSDHTGIPEEQIRRYCYDKNLKYKKTKKTKYDYSYVDLHYKDETISELSDHTGIPYSAISSHLDYRNKLKDCKKERAKGRSKYDLDSIENDLSSGKSYKQIYEIYKIPSSSFGHYFRKDENNKWKRIK